MKVLRVIRVALAALMFAACLAIFLDFTGVLPAYLGWVANVQCVPAFLALNAGVLIILIVLTILFGRVYCSVICPLGIFQDLFSGLRGRNSRYKFWKHRTAARVVRYAILGLFLILIALGAMGIVGAMEPYSAFGRMASTLFAPVYDWVNNRLASAAQARESYAFYSVDVWIRGTAPFVLAIVTFVGLAVAGIVTGRGYCTNLCPVGTFLGLLSKLAIFRVRLDASKCRNCMACSDHCKAHCIDVTNHRVDAERCVGCMNCLGTCKFGAIRFSPAVPKPLDELPASGQERKFDVPAEGDSIRLVANLVSDVHEIVSPTSGIQQIAVPEEAPEVVGMSPSSGEIRPISTVSQDNEVVPLSGDMPRVTRRDALMGSMILAGAALLPKDALCAEGDLAPVTRKEPYPRETAICPPGSIHARRFARHCTGCMLCVRACHNQVLRVDNSGLRPVLSFERGYCRPTCHDCGDVCPSGAILPLTREQKTSIQIGRAVWVKENCLNYVKGKRCKACKRACPNGAISLVEAVSLKGKPCQVPSVDTERCIGCGACEYVCAARPLAAIHVEGNVQQREV